MIWHSGWVWVVAGVVLGVLEMVLPGFILLGFAIGAVVTGLLLWGGVVGGLPLAAVLLIFAVLSGISWFGLKRVFGVPGERPKIWHRDINDN